MYKNCIYIYIYIYILIYIRIEYNLNMKLFSLKFIKLQYLLNVEFHVRQSPLKSFQSFTNLMC